MRYFKCTGPNGRSWYDDDVQYVVGQTLEHPDPDVSAEECGRGFHCSPFIHQTVKYAKKDLKQAEFFEVEVADDDILGRGSDKVRTKRLSVLRQLSESDFWIVRGTLIDAVGSGYGYGSGDGYGYGSGAGSGESAKGVEPIGSVGALDIAVAGPHAVAVGCHQHSLDVWRRCVDDLAEEHDITNDEVAAALALVEDFLRGTEAA